MNCSSSAWKLRQRLLGRHRAGCLGICLRRLRRASRGAMENPRHQLGQLLCPHHTRYRDYAGSRHRYHRDRDLIPREMLYIADEVFSPAQRLKFRPSARWIAFRSAGQTAGPITEAQKGVLRDCGRPGEGSPDGWRRSHSLFGVANRCGFRGNRTRTSPETDAPIRLPKLLFSFLPGEARS